MDCLLLVLLSMAPLVVLSHGDVGDAGDLAQMLIHKAQSHDVHGEIEGWQMEKLKDFIKLIKFQKFMKHDSQEEQPGLAKPDHGMWWSLMQKMESEKQWEENQQKVGIFKQLLAFMKSFQEKKQMMDTHGEFHEHMEAKEQLKRKMSAFQKHAGMHDFMAAMEKKRKMMEAMKKHEQMHKFLEALEEKKKMIEAMKKHEEFHDFVQMMQAQKKKMEAMKKHAQFHEYMDAVEEHKEHVHKMEKWNAVLALHAHAHKEEQDFGDMKLSLMKKKKQFVFTIVFEMMKFCKCRESIENLHRFFNPDLHTMELTGNNTGIMDIDEHIKYFHPQTAEQAKMLFMKGMLKTLCLTAKGYIQHVKAIVAQHLTQHLMDGGIGHGHSKGDSVDYINGMQTTTGSSSGGSNSNANVNGNGGAQSSNGGAQSSNGGAQSSNGVSTGGRGAYNRPPARVFGGSQTRNGY